MPQYAYRYSTVASLPLTHCPNCENHLTGPESVILVLAVAGRSVSVRTRLDQLGFLVDTEDQAIRRGLHSDTLCGKCGDRLADQTGVWEEQHSNVDPGA